jgi:hypothetical protein
MFRDYYGHQRIACSVCATVIAFLLLPQSGLGTLADDLRFECSSFMKDTAYRRPEKLAADAAASGAQSTVNIQWDETHTGKWYIEQQRYGSDAVCGGIAKEDITTIERGLRILRWGFEQQQPDGSFNCPDAFHSTSFFVEAAAHACLLLNASQYASKYAADVDWMKPRILKAALWMTQLGVEGPGKAHNGPYAHRRYLVAAALGEAGVLCENQSLIEKSRSYIREGISLQDPSGYNPEKGGFDSSYHAVGLYYAERYYDIVADAETKEQLRGMLAKGYAWLQSRILPDGTINVFGNTRTGAGQEKGRTGVPKTVNYGYTHRGFYRWYLISGDSTYERLAHKVFAGEEIYKRSIGNS